jgi:septal ring factor EnvC (AmiA/AmiB activator)
LKKDKANKEELLQTKIEERDLVLKDKLSKEATLAKYKKDEKKLQAELKANEKKKADLKKKIKSAIEKEIAEAEAKAKKSQAKKETKSSSSSTASSGSSSSSKSTSKEAVPTETKESLAMSKSFEGNRGKLPWPVLKGTIVEGYGKNPHPTLANVFTNNNGIDIGAPKNAQVRAVFEGEVSSIISIPGAGKCVIIKHGAYRTVYSNLQDVFVSVGTKVSTKQAIGSLLSEEGSSLSTAHFELHQVVNGSPQRINPTLWLAN